MPPTDAPDADAPPSGAPVPPPYEEITLADLVVSLRDHWRPAVAVLLVVLMLTTVVTVEQPVRYTAHATLLPTNQEKTTVTVLSSHRYAEAVAARLQGDGWAPGSGGTTLAGRVASATTVSVAPSAPGAGDVITVQVTWPSAAGAAAVADAFAASLPAARPILRNATFAALWPTYVERFNGSEARAGANLTAVVANMTFAEPLDAARLPTHPSSPAWRLNLALGATLGLMLAFLTPFTIEAYRNVRRELRERG